MQRENEDEDVVDDVSTRTLPPFTKDDNPHGLLADSSFHISFPKYREQYLKECFPLLKSKLNEHGVKAELDVVDGTMAVHTTKSVWDPYIIVKARDVILLLSRSVPYEQAIKVLDDDISCDIIKISGMTGKKETFVKRRERLVGPEGSTLKAIELLTNCYVLVQGQTVSAVGPYRGLSQVRKIVESTMKNVHPIYEIKQLMIRKELEKDPLLKNEDWSRFLPKFQNKNVKRKKSKFKKKATYTPFPPQQTESKVDKELASGEYFLKEHERQAQKLAQKNEKKKMVAQQRQEEKNKSFVPPDEEIPAKKMKLEDGKIDIEAFKRKIKSSQKRKGLPSSSTSKNVKKDLTAKGKGRVRKDARHKPKAGTAK